MRWASNAFEVQARICGISSYVTARVRHYHFRAHWESTYCASDTTSAPHLRNCKAWMRCAAKTCIEALAIWPQPTTHRIGVVKLQARDVESAVREGELARRTIGHEVSCLRVHVYPLRICRQGTRRGHIDCVIPLGTEANESEGIRSEQCMNLWVRDNTHLNSDHVDGHLMEREEFKDFELLSRTRESASHITMFSTTRVSRWKLLWELSEAASQVTGNPRRPSTPGPT